MAVFLAFIWFAFWNEARKVDRASLILVYSCGARTLACSVATLGDARPQILGHQIWESLRQ
jgi:hypothetical protein